MLKRSAVLGSGALLAGALSACSGEGADETAPPPQQNPETNSVQINNPKNAAAPELCELLPPEAAASMGLQPEGEMDDGPKISDDAPESCVWRTEDGANSVSLAAIENRSIQEYYDNKSAFSDYEELTIAGHPAVRANQGNPSEDGWCAMFLATDDKQMLYGFSRDSSKADTCGMAQKALEASVPTLPAAG